MEKIDLAKNIAKKVNEYRVNNGENPISQWGLYQKLMKTGCSYSVLIPKLLVKKGILKIHSNGRKKDTYLYVFTNSKKPVEYNVFFEIIDNFRKKGIAYYEKSKENNLQKAEKKENESCELSKYPTSELINEIIVKRQLPVLLLYNHRDLYKKIMKEIYEQDGNSGLLKEFQEKELVEELRKRDVIIKATMEL